jgi:V/A-type H+/Na+-transporting ATPase subunit A
MHATATRAGARRKGRLAALLAEADRLSLLAELIGASAMPGRERIMMLAGRLVREAVLQQNALSSVDFVCPAARAAALADMVLSVTDRCQELVAAGADAPVVEDQDFSPVLRARDDAATIEAVHAGRDVMLARLAWLASEPGQEGAALT